MLYSLQFASILENIWEDNNLVSLLLFLRSQYLGRNVGMRYGENGSGGMTRNNTWETVDAG